MDLELIEINNRSVANYPVKICNHLLLVSPTLDEDSVECSCKVLKGVGIVLIRLQTESR
eukprot:SAG31_NODE_31338_length_369_cov_0.940741_1_plen_58_part_10